MTYNVLHYGDRCQGSNSFLHQQLKTIVQYEKPDVLGLVKVQSIKLSAADLSGISRMGFADSILNNALNAAYPVYDHCPVVNFSGDGDDDMDLLFYNKSKLGFLSIVNLCSIQEDFNLYKLYYKDPNLATTKDTTFLYFILNHTVSGTVETSRDQQDSAVVKSLRKRFSHLPNLISMGDFNTHSSYEAGYQLLTATKDSSFMFFDPPFFPDNKINYPASWEDNASAFASYLNTSTRQTTIPNSCGTANGVKDWYLHILVSPWVVKNSNYVKYVPNSYTTIGNDGHRLGISINDSSSIKNTSVPSDVLNALFQFSDKYPVMVKLSITRNTSGVSPDDPDVSSQTVTGTEAVSHSAITVSNPVENYIGINFPSSMVGQDGTFKWCDLLGRTVQYSEHTVTSQDLSESTPFVPGVYVFIITVNCVQYSFRVIRN
jgi:hypothetical protein